MNYLKLLLGAAASLLFVASLGQKLKVNSEEFTTAPLRGASHPVNKESRGSAVEERKSESAGKRLATASGERATGFSGDGKVGKESGVGVSSGNTLKNNDIIQKSKGEKEADIKLLSKSDMAPSAKVADSQKPKKDNYDILIENIGKELDFQVQDSRTLQKRVVKMNGEELFKKVKSDFAYLLDSEIAKEAFRSHLSHYYQKNQNLSKLYKEVGIDLLDLGNFARFSSLRDAFLFYQERERNKE